MGVLYDQAPDEVHEMAADIMVRHHEELKLPDGSYVKLCILMAFQEDRESDEPAVKDKAGYPSAAAVSIISYKNRVDHRADAEILLDQWAWDKMTDRQQRATLDEMITHLQLQVDENLALKTDDAGRPKLTLRMCDWHLQGFESIARRYGEDALEVKNVRAFQEKYGAVTLAPEKASPEKEPEPEGMFT